MLLVGETSRIKFAAIAILVMTLTLSAVRCGGSTDASTSGTPTNDRVDVLKALESSNAFYVAAFRSGDIRQLRAVTTGEALAYYEESMSNMLARKERLDASLLESTLISVDLTRSSTAVVRTKERWLIRWLELGGGPIREGTYENDYEYEFVKRNGAWILSLISY
jgi:hypothetical protein